MTELLDFPISRSAILTSLTPYMTLKEKPVENTTTTATTTTTGQPTNTTSSCITEPTRFWETFSFGFGSGFGAFLFIALIWILYSNLCKHCRSKPPPMYKSVNIDETNSIPDFLRNV